MTVAPASAASLALRSSESLSTTITSPVSWLPCSAVRAADTQAWMFSSSLRQGITTDTNGRSLAVSGGANSASSVVTVDPVSFVIGVELSPVGRQRTETPLEAERDPFVPGPRQQP